VECVAKTATEYKKEKTRPDTGNLATHIRLDHPEKRNSDASTDNTTLPIEDGIGPGTSKLMANYLAGALLNPAIPKTQEWFHRLFASWVIDDDQPWTTGESGSIKRLFKFVDCRYQLPTDTTVRKYAKLICSELNAKVVRELTVCITSLLVL